MIHLPNCVRTHAQLTSAIVSGRRTLGRILLLALLIVCTVNSLSAQLSELNQSIQLLSASSNAADQALAAELQHLCYDLVPTAYVNDGVLDTSSTDDDVACVELRVSQLGLIDSSDPVILGAEIIKIRIQDSTDLAVQVDSGMFPATAHIVVLAEFEIEPSSLVGMFGNDPGRPIYFSISIPR